MAGIDWSVEIAVVVAVVRAASKHGSLSYSITWINGMVKTSLIPKP